MEQSRDEAHDLLYWQEFVDRFYSPVGVLRQGVYNRQSGSKQFEISTPALARYYLTQFNSGIRHIQMLVEGVRETASSTGGHIVESAKTSFIYWFTNDSQVRIRVRMAGRSPLTDISTSCSQTGGYVHTLTPTIKSKCWTLSS